MSKGDRIADEAIYVDAEGKRVKATDPKAAIKVVGKGGVITAAMASKYKLDAPKKGDSPQPENREADQDKKLNKR